MIGPLPKRLIEVDLPIARISAHARREKSIRHGHISTLHIWWARRPLAACRAVICAALWPDPADEHCPQDFRDAAARTLLAFAKRFDPARITEEKAGLLATASPENRTRWEVLAKNDPPLDPTEPAHQNVLRFALLDFIADFANWDNSTVPAYLETSRALTQAAHEALGGEPGTRPLVVDPFAGGGSIPLEALRVGADAFASDLNPVAVLLNKVVLEYIPKFGQKLADEVRKWGAWIKEQAEKELAEFYPKDEDGATPIAYLWARTIRCEGAGCGAEVPLMRSLWLAKKANKSVALKIVPKAMGVDFEIVNDAKAKDVGEGTVRRGSGTCPCCGYTTPVKSVREQLKKRKGGAADARMFCVVTSRPNIQGRYYRLPTKQDNMTVERATTALQARIKKHDRLLPLIPAEHFTGIEPRRIPLPQYGIMGFGDMFTPRQSLTLGVLAEKLREAAKQITAVDPDFKRATIIALSFAVDRIVDQMTSLVLWASTIEVLKSTFGRQALPMTWDFVEAQPFAGSAGDFGGAIEWVVKVCEKEGSSFTSAGSVTRCSASKHVLPDDVCDAVITDPPYYYSVPYSDLSDFFYVWLKRLCSEYFPEHLSAELTPKEDEIVQNLPHSEVAHLQKSRKFFEDGMRKALSESRRYAKRNGIAVVVFAHSQTEAWESLLQALIESGWIVTGSWPIDTERGARTVAQRQSTLTSSVHLVCRPRIGNEIGDWRDILSELPIRMHEWMPRLASEGVVGADAIFACLGPALEIFSRYSRVERSVGGRDVPVPLKEYLEQVWAAVSKEALSVIFRDADATGLEPDARLTAMWLWTVGGGKAAPASKDAADEPEESDDEDEKPASKAAPTGFGLEFDAARMIAQGLGIHLEKSESIVEVKGDKARLLAVAERTKYLFGKDTQAGAATKKAKKPKQLTMFAELEEVETAEGGWKELKGPPPGTTILDRLHQAMILFGAQRGELLKRFLVEDGVGKDARFWKLAQSLAALYPTGTDERRWVEGVLARKKGLGL